MAKIGVRELRQNASVYLARVQEGEVIEVSVRGKSVARIVPALDHLWERLLSEGRIRPPLPGARLEDIEPVAVSGVVETPTDVLRSVREAER